MPSRYGKSTWSRLRPLEQDPLESVGLPSKGDSRLLDLKAQEKYYTKIVQRYMGFCSDAGERDELLRRFESMQLNHSMPAPSSSSSSSATTKPASSRAQNSQRTGDVSNTKALSDVLMALRKLREGIVASKRVDDFAVQAYLFCIRVSIMARQPESYHPAILHLLKRIVPQYSLTSVEFQEVVGYLVLDTACRRGQLLDAFIMRKQYALKDAKIDALLSALVHDNYVLFRRIKDTVDGHKLKLIEFAEPEMRMHSLKCFGKSYLSVDLPFLERSTSKTWEEMKRDDGVGWELDGTNVVIRRVRAK